MICFITIIIFDNVKPELFLFPDFFFLIMREKKNRLWAQKLLAKQCI